MRLPAALREQAKSCQSLGSPFMDRLLRCLADHMPRDTALFDKMEHWPAPLGPSHASLPLRLAGGLHHLVLTNADAALAEIYPPSQPHDDSFRAEVVKALDRNQTFLIDWIDRPPQTNEVRRSVGLIPAANVIAARYPLPFVISELGASGGLNLMFDRFAVQAGDSMLGNGTALTLTPEWSGPVPPSATVTITNRRGVDLTPLDLRRPTDVTRLLSYLWADQPDRRDLTQNAVSCFDAQVDAGDAVDWLEHRLAMRHPGHVHMIYHTVAWQYFPPDVQARGEDLLTRAGEQATKDAPLARVAMEADAAGRGAALTLTLWPGGETRQLARIDFHGRWIDWTG